MATKTLAESGKRRMVQHLTSGDVWITDGSADSIPLDHLEVERIVADPGLMELADLEPRATCCAACEGTLMAHMCQHPDVTDCDLEAR